MQINPILRGIIERMSSKPVAVAPAFVHTMTADLRLFAMADPEKEQKMSEAFRGEMLAAFGLNRPLTNDKTFAFSQGIAVIPVTGMLINRFGSSWGSYATGYNFIRSQMNAAMTDPDVKCVLLDVNTYGGQVDGCFELSNDIREMRCNDKRIVAMVDSNCYSAGYATASAADEIIVTPSGGAGSIGVLQMHMSYEGMLAEEGIKVTLIHAGEHKVDGNCYNDLPDDVKAEMQASVDATRQKFAELVATNRGLDVQAVLDTEARCYQAEDALAAGLIDKIATPTECIASLLSELSVSSSMKSERHMTVQTQGAEATTAQSADQARMAERQRIGAIMGLPEAKGKSALANHIALNTELSVDDAKGMLAVAAAEAQTAAVEQNHFETAMANTPNPEVGAEAAAAQSQQQQESSLLTFAKAKVGARQ